MQIARCAIPRVRWVAVVVALAFAMTACGVKGPLVPAPKDGETAPTPPSTLIKDPAQPERRP
jgi:predicted small lipoprotein YifL